MSDHGTFLGLYFVRCTNCPRVTLEPGRAGWRFYADVRREMHPFCPSCADTEFGSARSEGIPVPVCPTCEGELHPQPHGGWVCKDHGFVISPSLRFG